ncbi:MAG: Deoxyadenosine/deoxycytidine kinase [Bacteroidota bacterium]|jgi:deoxyadenosine/deoxycytidine kinase
MHIAIAGNIGSGKTTLATQLSKYLGFEVQYEDADSNPYLFDFYQDMQRWSFNLQIYFLNTRFKKILDIHKQGKNILQDRTIYEDAQIFAPNLHAMGLMAKRDYDSYKSLFDNLNDLIPPPDLLIYLRGSIPTLVDQIQRRGREYEDSIRLDYLRRLNERYEAWYEGYTLGNKMEIIIDELNFRDNPEHLGIIINRVKADLFGLFGTK